MRTHPLRSTLVLILACLLAILFYFLGMVVPQANFRGGFLLPIVVAFLWGRRRDIYIVTALASMLAPITFWAGGSAGLDSFLVNQLLPLGILWATAWLLAQRRQILDRQQELAAEVAARKAELEASEQRYRLLAENASDLIWAVDMDGVLTYVSPAVERMRGVTREEEHSADWSDRMPPQFAAAVSARVAADLASLRAGTPIERVPRVTQAYRKDGSLFWIETVLSPLYDDAGRPLGLCGTTRDITARHQAEEALRRSEDRFNKLFSSSPVGITLTRLADGRFQEANGAFLAMIGCSREEIIGRSSLELGLISPKDWARRNSVLQVQDGVQGEDLVLHTKRGEEMHTLLAAEIVDFEDEPCLLSSTVDITERKQLADALAAGKARLRAVIENTDDSVWSVDVGYRFLAGNSVFARSVQQQIGRPLAVGDCVLDAPFPLSARDFWQPLYDRALAGESFMVEMLSSLRSGGTLACYLHPIYAADGAVAGVSGRAADITGLKQIEMQLRTAYQRLRLAADAAQIGIWNWNFADDSLEWDDRICDLYAVPPAMRAAGLYNQFWRARVHPDDLAAIDTSLAAVRRDGTDWNSTFRIVLPTGQVRHIYSACIVEQDAAGAPLRMVGINRDITDQVLYAQLLLDTNVVLEQQVAQRTAEVQDLYDSAPTGFHTLDTNGCFVRVNQTELNWLGYTREELVGRSFAEFVTPAGQAAFRANFPVFKQRGWARDLEYDLVRKGGTTFPVLVNATAVYDEQGSYVASRGTLYDNTERQRTELALRSSEEALRLANNEMARALRLKDEFMAMISHELRTPLTGVLSMAEMLEDEIAGPLNARQVTYVRGITASGERLLHVINGILGYTHLLSGKVQFQAESCNLASVLDSCATSQQQKATERKQTIRVQVEPSDLAITGDAVAIADLFKRLLDNAIKFTPEGGQIGLEACAGAAPSTVDLVVWDTGSGIAADQLEHILKPFAQADSGLARSHEGIGLGLAYVGQMVHLMRGAISVESALGEGSRFTVTLPV